VSGCPHVLTLLFRHISCHNSEAITSPTEGLGPHLPQSVALPSPLFFHAFFSSCIALLFTGLLVMMTFAGDECFGMLIVTCICLMAGVPTEMTFNMISTVKL